MADPAFEEEPYYPCNDSNQPVCRQFVNQGKCRKNQKCRFYHPTQITNTIRRKATRPPGRCYCGASLKCLINMRNYSVDEEGTKPTFFYVCGRTMKSIKRCL